MMKTLSRAGVGDDRLAHSAAARAASDIPAIVATDQGKAPPKSCGAIKMVAHRAAVSGRIGAYLFWAKVFMVAGIPSWFR
jgi:hypothetical protein